MPRNHAIDRIHALTKQVEDGGHLVVMECINHCQYAERDSSISCTTIDRRRNVRTNRSVSDVAGNAITTDKRATSESKPKRCLTNQVGIVEEDRIHHGDGPNKLLRLDVAFPSSTISNGALGAMCCKRGHRMRTSLRNIKGVQETASCKSVWCIPSVAEVHYVMARIRSVLVVALLACALQVSANANSEQVCRFWNRGTCG